MTRENERRARELLHGTWPGSPPLGDVARRIADALDEAEARWRNQALVIVESELIPDRDHSSEDYAAGYWVMFSRPPGRALAGSGD